MEQPRNELSLGLSTCPNDTFIFYALLHGRVPCPCLLRPFMADVEELNHQTLARSLDVSKISYQLLGHIRDDYILLRAGSALGRGCGPLLVTRRPLSREELSVASVAIPGEHTTAALLLKLFNPEIKRTVAMNFAAIAPAVARGEVDAGVIIHETRFTYETLGLSCVMDLGAWWEGETGMPIPLGGIVAKRSLGAGLLEKLDRAIHDSVAYAARHTPEAMDFIRGHAQELNDDVIRSHIGLYVTDFTLDLGAEGLEAITRLIRMGEERGLFPPARQGDAPLVLPERSRRG